MDVDLRQTLLGTVLQGASGARYRLTELVEENARGVIFRAERETAAAPGQTCLVTVHWPDVLPQDHVDIFHREAHVLVTALGLVRQTARELVQVPDHGAHDLPGPVRLGFLVREHVTGQSLAKIIALHGGFGVPVARARRIAGHVARALHALHELGIVHAELTPKSVIVVQDGGQERARIADYPVPRARTLAPTVKQDHLGYKPPEEFQQPTAANHPTYDVFTFATILYELLCGTEAFTGVTLAHLARHIIEGERPSLARVRATLPAELRDRPDLVASLDREIIRAMSPDPRARHQSIRDLWAALEPLLREAVRPGRIAGFSPDDPVTADSLVPLSRAASSPEIPLSVAVPSAAVPPSVARSVPQPLAAPMPAWQQIGPPIPGEQLLAALVTEEGRALLAVGKRGMYRLARCSWSRAPLPAGVDPSLIRGLSRMPTGEILLYGENGFCVALSSRGTVRKIVLPERDVMLLGGFVDERGIVLVGERMSRPVGVCCVVSQYEPLVTHTIEACPRLTSAARFAGVATLVVGPMGALFEIDARGTREVPWGRTGHLSAVASGHDGVAYAVGTGGHALRVERTSSATVATLESVQTTRDLLSVEVDPITGSAWAAGADARLLERRRDAWIRVPLDASVTSSLLCVWPRSPRLVVLAEDGSAFACDSLS